VGHKTNWVHLRKPHHGPLRRSVLGGRMKKIGLSKKDIEYIKKRVSDRLPFAGISTRTTNALRAVGITTYSALCKLTRDDVLKIPRIGRKSYSEIKFILKERGLSLTKNPGSPVYGPRELTEREKNVLSEREGGTSLSTLAKKLGISLTRVVQIEKRAQELRYQRKRWRLPE